MSPVSPRCSVPPAFALFSNKSSHFAAFSFSLNAVRGVSMSRNVNGDRLCECDDDDGDGDPGEPRDFDEMLIVRRVRLKTSMEREGRMVVREEDIDIECTGDGFVVDTGEGDADSDDDGASRRELLRGRGGAGCDESDMPNSDMLRERGGGAWKLLTAPVVLNAGIVGEGGE